MEPRRFPDVAFVIQLPLEIVLKAFLACAAANLLDQASWWNGTEDGIQAPDFEDGKMKAASRPEN